MSTQVTPRRLSCNSQSRGSDRRNRLDRRIIGDSGCKGPAKRRCGLRVHQSRRYYEIQRRWNPALTSCASQDAWPFWRSGVLELCPEMGSSLGALRVVVPHASGQAQLVAPLLEFLRTYPDVSVEWILHDRHPNFIAEGIDCAIHWARWRIRPWSRFMWRTCRGSLSRRRPG